MCCCIVGLDVPRYTLDVPGTDCIEIFIPGKSESGASGANLRYDTFSPDVLTLLGKDECACPEEDPTLGRMIQTTHFSK